MDPEKMRVRPRSSTRLRWFRPGFGVPCLNTLFGICSLKEPLWNKRLYFFSLVTSKSSTRVPLKGSIRVPLKGSLKLPVTGSIRVPTKGSLRGSFKGFLERAL